LYQINKAWVKYSNYTFSSAPLL